MKIKSCLETMIWAAIFISVLSMVTGCKQRPASAAINTDSTLNHLPDKDTNSLRAQSLNADSTTRVSQLPILFSLNYDLPVTIPLNVFFTLDGKIYKFYGHGIQSSEVDGIVVTEFSITAEIFSELSYDYGEGPLPDGISFAYDDSALLKRDMVLENSKTYLKLKGQDYSQEKGSMIISKVEGNKVSGSFTMLVHTKHGKLISIEDGRFVDLPVKRFPTENE